LANLLILNPGQDLLLAIYHHDFTHWTNAQIDLRDIIMPKAENTFFSLLRYSAAFTRCLHSTSVAVLRGEQDDAYLRKLITKQVSDMKYPFLFLGLHRSVKI
jgi:hypothetical protein